ncbi:MAG: molybdopterin-guanine dinucleotide biosynthesis protein B [Gemmatimonadetes bacterium]|nr:molybdopterin-guanine dinucleotide biosynthesis protein B [Gemmatimonadota bacterium]
MAATRVIAVVGKKDAGKTTLVVALASEFARRGRRVATIKHGTHPAQVDTPGTDTYRHYREGMAAQVLMEFPGGRVMFERVERESDPVSLIRRYLEAQIVLVEGFTKSPLPKVEVHRTAAHKAPLFDPASPDASRWVAVVTDDEALRLSVPIFRFSDTAWLPSLANLVWERAEQLAD